MQAWLRAYASSFDRYGSTVSKLVVAPAHRASRTVGVDGQKAMIVDAAVELAARR